MLLVVMTAGAAKRQGHFFMSLKGQNVTTENIEQRFGEWFSLPEGTEWRMVSQRTNRHQDMTRMEYRQYVGGVEVEHSQGRRYASLTSHPSTLTKGIDVKDGRKVIVK